MSTATRAAYQHRFTGWIAPAGSRRMAENKAFCGRQSTLHGKGHSLLPHI